MGLLDFSIGSSPDPNAMVRSLLAARANAPAATMKPSAQPQGFLSRIGNALTSDRLQAIGAGLHDLGSGTNTLDSVLESLRQAQQQRQENLWQQDAINRQNAQFKFQATGQERQMQGLVEMRDQIARTHPELLGAFDADPQGFLQTYISRQMPEWQTQNATRAYRVLPDGSTQLGGAIPIKPNMYTFGGGTDAPTFVPNPAGVSAPRSVSTPQEAQALPPGTHYRTPDGREFIR